MSGVTSVWRHRLARLKEICGAKQVSGPGMRSEAPLLAIASSRLGVDAHFHQHVCQFLRRSLMDCQQRGSELLVGTGSAIEPWAERGAELFGVPCRKFAVSSVQQPAHLPAHLIVSSADSAPISVDAAVIALADRVDVVYARRGGRIAMCLGQRLKVDIDASIRVAITLTSKCAAHELINDGAVGWVNMDATSPEMGPSDSLKPNQRVMVDDHPENLWGQAEAQWLIHCTRGRIGRWPDETERQYRDSMLLGAACSARRGPLDALTRIVRSGRILASARASDHDYPVVCFSALSLQRLMDSRCFRPHLGRWDYEPYGIAIRASTAQNQGVRPVIYGSQGDRAGVPEEDRFRFHPRGKTYDWSREREWRSRQSIDLESIDRQDVRVFALDSSAARSALRHCPWRVSFLSTVDRDVRSV